MKSTELPAEKRCYTIGDLQAILSISRGSVYKLLERREFHWFKIGSTYRISRQSFDSWMEEKT